MILIAQTQLYFEPEDVSAQLSRLGLTMEDVTAALFTGHQHAALCTEHDVPGAAGYSRWNKTLRGLRDRLVENGKGWRSINGLLCTVENAKLGIAITVGSGDHNTGIRDRTPSTKNPRGSASTFAIDTNHVIQVPLPLPGLTEVYEAQVREFEARRDDPAGSPNGGITTWWLLVYPIKNGVRAELSLPVEVVDGKVTAWTQRIIIGDVDFTEPSAIDDLPSFDSGPAFDIEVKPRLG